MHYATVFLATASPFRNWAFAGAGLLFVLAGALMVFRPEWLKAVGFRDMGKLQRPFGWFFLVFAIFWTTISGWSVIGSGIRASQDLRSGNCQMLEGVVENFTPMPFAGHGMESFEVRGIKFAYSDYVLSAGFNNTASHGGPIRKGLPVRICHRDGEILRLEVAR